MNIREHLRMIKQRDAEISYRDATIARQAAVLKAMNDRLRHFEEAMAVSTPIVFLPAGDQGFTDADRYLFLRALAVARPGVHSHQLEAFVALNQLDHIYSAEGIDAVIDAAIREQGELT